MSKLTLGCLVLVRDDSHVLAIERVGVCIALQPVAPGYTPSAVLRVYVPSLAGRYGLAGTKDREIEVPATHTENFGWRFLPEGT